jgi:hypothetical protein
MKYLIALLLCGFTFSSHAAIIGLTQSGAKISAVRIESRWGFISFTNRSSPAACPEARVDLNLESEPHRMAYSTALAAFMAEKHVVIRVDDASAKVFNACSLYDIYVTD